LKLTGLKFRKIERRLDDILYTDAETRVKAFIRDYVTENGKESDLWVKADNIFSHSEIAKLTSTSRQTVNNLLSQWRKSGELAYSRNEISLKVIKEPNGQK
jgi:CRP/FNR family cyclic AMP-dependent transcriptional regulator